MGLFGLNAISFTDKPNLINLRRRKHNSKIISKFIHNKLNQSFDGQFQIHPKSSQKATLEVIHRYKSDDKVST